MPDYAVSAIDRQGIRRSLREAAPDEPALRAKLHAKALWPVRIRPVKPGRNLTRLRLPLGDFIPLLHQLELQLRAGVTADVALAHLAEDAPPGPGRLMLSFT